MSIVTDNAIESFRRNTKYDIDRFIFCCSIFFQSDYGDILLFYSGKSNKSDIQISIENLNSLLSEYEIIEQLYKTHSKKFNNAEDFEFCSYLSDLGTKLKTIKKSYKYLKSNISGNIISDKISFTETLRQHGTLESIAGELSYNNPTDDWQEISRQNDLFEQDYSVRGGNVLKLQGQNQITTSNIEAVVDVINGNSILGKDINRRFNFKDGDIDVLSPEETFLQGVDIKAKLIKGDIPEYPNIGISRNLTIGNSLGAVTFPSFIRQLNETFAVDDTISKFNVLTIKYSEGDIVVEYEAVGRYEIKKIDIIRFNAKNV